MPDEEVVVEVPAEESQEVSLEEAGLSGEKEEIIDPGQMEGKPKPRHEDEPGPETPRFKKIYARLKGAEETIEGLKSDKAEKEAVMSEVRKHNAALMEKLEALSNRAIDAVETARTPAGEPEEIVSIRQAIADLESRKEEAVENLKGKEVVQIDRELHKLERIVAGYEYHAAQQKESKKRPPTAPDPASKQPPMNPDVEVFEREATWYNKDPIMTGAAKEYDLYLSQSPEWKGKPFGERLRKVKEDIETRFNSVTPSKPKPVGAESGLGLQRPPGQQSAKTVKLSAEELAVVQGLGITPEAYAKQKNFLGGAV